MSSIPLLVGSKRPQNNGDGIAEFIVERWHVVSEGKKAAVRRAEELMSSRLSLPDGAYMGTILSRDYQTSAQYDTAEEREWSRIVYEAPAVVIVTPQYNWGIPGTLKNTLDQLFNEWKAKPILVFTYGGHGGSKCAEQMKQVLVGGLKATLVVDPIMITLPPEYIQSTGGKRVGRGSGESRDDFLHEATEKIDAALKALVDALN